MGSNTVVRQFEAIAGHQWSDSAGEERTVYDAEGLVRDTRRALMDNLVTVAEADGILAQAEEVLRGCRASLARNVHVQREIEEFRGYLGRLPADALARMPRPVPQMVEEHPLFTAQAVLAEYGPEAA